MISIDVEGTKVELLENGFLEDINNWTLEVAKELAHQQDITELTEDHWKLINYIRDYYKEFSVPPMIKRMMKVTGFDLTKIYDLFPKGPIEGAIKIAGLPEPTGCV